MIWIFCRKKDYVKNEKNPTKTLKIICNSNESYDELVTYSSDVSIHQKYWYALVTKIYKSLVDINPDFMKPYFTIK